MDPSGHAIAALEHAIAGRDDEAVREYKLAFACFFRNQWAKRARNHEAAPETVGFVLDCLDHNYRECSWEERILMIDSIRGLLSIYECHLASEFGFKVDQKGDS